MIRLLLADDQDIFRQGLACLLSVEPDLEVVGQARNGHEAIALAKTLQPHVILMDVQMPAWSFSGSKPTPSSLISNIIPSDIRDPQKLT